MSDVDVVLEPATEEELADVEAILGANDLPTVDVRESPGRFFLALDDGAVVGVGGVEVHGSFGLLRSLVVRETARGEGYGTAICAALEREARDAGVDDLYLLTTTAAGFFDEQGYERVDREAVPGPIRETAEFAELCPASATCMRTSLSA